MTFKEYIEQDQEVYMNDLEFAEIHSVSGRQIRVVVDNDRLIHRSKVEYEGVIVGDILYFAKVSDYVKPPKIDDVQSFDNVYCTVFDVRKDMGIYEIILKKNVS